MSSQDSDLNSAKILRSIRKELATYLEGEERLVRVKIGRIENSKVYGFVKLESEATHRHFLHTHFLDFEATSTCQGALSSLEVDGRKVTIHAPESTGA